VDKVGASLVGKSGTSWVGAAGVCGVSAFASISGTAADEPSAALGGAADGDKGGAGGFGTVCMPGALGAAGTRGKENNSLIGGKTGAAARDAPFSLSKKYGLRPIIGDVATTGTFACDDGIALRSAPPGGAVGADVGIPEMPGKENISLPDGNAGATAIGEIFPSNRKSGGAPGAGGTGAVPGDPGTNAVEPANDEAIARKSVSVSGPGWIDGGEAGIPGADSTADVS